MRGWVVVTMSCLVLAAVGLADITPILVADHECADDGCSPVGDGCGDCVQCAHPHALVGGAGLSVLPPTARPTGAAPRVSPETAPPSAPAREILTVPRA